MNNIIISKVRKLEMYFFMKEIMSRFKIHLIAILGFKYLRYRNIYLNLFCFKIILSKFNIEGFCLNDWRSVLHVITKNS